MKPIWAIAIAIMTSTTFAAAVGAQTQAGAQKTDTTPRGAEIVAHGTSAGAVACARCHGFDGLSDGSGAFPILANQSADYLSKQLRDFASGTRQCSGHSRSRFQPRVSGGQWGNGAMGNARWTGVRLADLLRNAGAKPGTAQFQFQGLERGPGPVPPTLPCSRRFRRGPGTRRYRR